MLIQDVVEEEKIVCLERSLEEREREKIGKMRLGRKVVWNSQNSAAFYTPFFC